MLGGGKAMQTCCWPRWPSRLNNGKDCREAGQSLPLTVHHQNRRGEEDSHPQVLAEPPVQRALKGQDRLGAGLPKPVRLCWQNTLWPHLPRAARHMLRQNQKNWSGKGNSRPQQPARHFHAQDSTQNIVSLH